MLDLFRRIIGKDAKPATPPATAPARLGTTPAGPPRAPIYDSGLVSSLKHDHHELVELFEQIGRGFEHGRFGEIPSKLVAFKTRLEAHLLTENVRFYNYVEFTLRDDSENLALIRDFRREMNTIARGVIDFVKKYQAGINSELARQSFLADYRAVGGLLVQRIQREEGNLYPLYMPS
ncbi:hemerythrin domain-containing protein [Tahibacter amnicola]|uniref:Hemerythrin domain-containing protein n=1 Tax=Tahibacter amnicola TaxID=2976241 RepID=A0ABY6BEP2_9GAMM|nr:hemerythrin domain-containing protein [Tahibacter amnicola]UXI68509.1 hemerythrin domain-containing protein [Tahibacter amnicola]